VSAQGVGAAGAGAGAASGNTRAERSARGRALVAVLAIALAGAGFSSWPIAQFVADVSDPTAAISDLNMILAFGLWLLLFSILLARGALGSFRIRRFCSEIPGITPEKWFSGVLRPGPGWGLWQALRKNPNAAVRRFNLRGKGPMTYLLLFLSGASWYFCAIPTLFWSLQPSVPRVMGLAIFWRLHFAFRHAAYRRIAAPSNEIRAKDARAVLLFLRSFAADDIMSLGKGWRRIFTAGRRFEEEVTELLWQWGPVVAIGQPREKIPRLGAAREYVAHANWQERVAQLVQEARLVLLMVGKTPGLAWEVSHVASHGAEGKLVLVFPPLKKKMVAGRWEIFRKEVAQSVAWFDAASIDPATTLLIAFRPGREAVVVTARGRRQANYDAAFNLVAWSDGRAATQAIPA